jgi:hypothetical protein
MKPARIESRIRLLIISFASLIILVFSGIGWLILLDAEDEIHDRFFHKRLLTLLRENSAPISP